MRRSLSSRVFSLVLSLWLPLFMSGAEWAVRCPTHGGGAAVSASDHGIAASTAAVDHSSHGAAEHSAPANHDGSGHNCSCPGPGCSPAAVALVPEDAVPLAHIVAVHEATAIATLDRLASVSDHVLPFATAPPAVALAFSAPIVA
jgi:hypothetical protein